MCFNAVGYKRDGMGKKKPSISSERISRKLKKRVRAHTLKRFFLGKKKSIKKCMVLKKKNIGNGLREA
jgi:hypothetical protein